MKVTEGLPEPLGVTADPAGVNVAVQSAHATAIAFCLFDDNGQREIARHALPGRTGDVFHGHVAGVRPGARYGLRAAGPWDPGHGHRFNQAKLLVDPQATALDRPFVLDPTLLDGDQPNPTDSAPVVPKAVVGPIEAIPAPAARTGRSLAGLVIYELHVRGFTRLHPDIPPAMRGTFAGLGHPAAIAHLRRLGVTAVELMPCAAWIDERHLPPLGLTDYWGYNPVTFCAPDPRLAPGGWPEIRTAVAALHEAGIAVLLDVVLNHSGEGDQLGPTLSLRGLDNATYYRLNPADPSRYIDDTGCGNALALDRPAALRLAMDALRAWALRAGIDGFRFDLATTLGRRPDGFDPAAPLLAAIAQDPVLRAMILVAEPWDVGMGGYRLGAFPPPWAEWNDRFRDTVRRFWRGDGGMLGALATRIAGSADVFAGQRRPSWCSLNFVTAHDGFTMADLVAYERKRNADNGEQNRDGTDDNESWNHGVEGPTDDPAILARRAADVRAMLATLLLARGTPMLTMGDECGRTQRGNNNAYAQDNPISWLDWEAREPGLLAYTARLIAARLATPALTAGVALTGVAAEGETIPDVAWLRPDGAAMRVEDWEAAENRTLIAAFHQPGSRALLALHGGAQPVDIVPPPPRDGQVWRIAVDSAAPDREGTAAPSIAVAARSVLLLVEAASPA